MDKNDRLKNLEAWRIKKNIEENAKALAEEERKAKIIADIEALWPRAQEMITLYNAGLKSGLKYPEEKWASDTTRPFVSNSWSHWLEFGYATHNGVIQRPKMEYPPVSSISIRGGGACYYEIDLYQGHLYYSGSSSWGRLNKFVEDFDKFEEYFYDWFDKATA